jgi:hypothetical protein
MTTPVTVHVCEGEHYSSVYRPGDDAKPARCFFCAKPAVPVRVAVEPFVIERLANGYCKATINDARVPEHLRSSDAFHNEDEAHEWATQTIDHADRGSDQ